nr:MAG TPA: hypothetical protein [Caudoviricetes sp.]
MAVYELQISETERATADYSQCQTHYSDFIGDDVELFVIESFRDDYSHLSADNEHAKAIRRFVESFNYYSHTNWRELLQRAISLYFHSKGLDCIFTDLRGYSQSEWATVVIYSTDRECNDYLNQTAKTIDSWFKGDYYDISLESAKVYTAQDGDTITQWQVEDVMYCVMIENEQDFIHYVRVDFDKAIH